MKLVAACDHYESKLTRCKERWGEDVDTTMEYEEILAREGYHDQYDHFVNFFKAIREDQPVLQDASYGLRAAGPALLANKSQ